VRRNLENVPAITRLHHVEDGEAAIDYIFGLGIYADRAHFPAPDLVLLDLHLPRVSGLEVLRRVKSHPTLHRVPIVMLTTSDAERDMAMAYEFRANSFVTKPVNFQSLAHLLTKLGVGWPAADQNSPAPARIIIEP